MKFFDLVYSHSWLTVKEKILELYPDQEKNIPGYRLAYGELQAISELIPSEMIISIRKVESEDGGYEDVYGIVPDDPMGYALDFIDWREVLGMEISEEITEKYVWTDILAHIMYEITFYGYSNEAVEENRKVILEEVKMTEGEK